MISPKTVHPSTKLSFHVSFPRINVPDLSTRYQDLNGNGHGQIETKLLVMIIVRNGATIY